MEKESYPRSLSEFETRFSSQEDCLQYLTRLRWPKGFVCPQCGGVDAWLTARFNRRTSASRGKLFFRLVQHLLDVDPVPRPTLLGLCKGDAEDEFDENGAEVIDHYL